MEKFSAAQFYAIGQFLAKVHRNVDDLIERNSINTILGAVSGEDSPGKERVIALKVRCEELGLKVSAKAVEHLLTLRTNGATLGAAKEAVGQVERTIFWEMEDRLFMYVPTDRAAYYDQKELFGSAVNAKFPTTQFDIVEAGNCYAAGRGTAAVFHLMRIMETGVQAFGTKLGVTFADGKNWQNILDEINKKIKGLPPKDPATVKMSEISANLYAVKLAWRNEVMHPKDTYTLEEAENLIWHVHSFMEQLAAIV